MAAFPSILSKPASPHKMCGLLEVTVMAFAYALGVAIALGDHCLRRKER